MATYEYTHTIIKFASGKVLYLLAVRTSHTLQTKNIITDVRCFYYKIVLATE